MKISTKIQKRITNNDPLLTKLDLSYMDLADTDISLLVELVYENMTIKEINLRGNKVTSVGAKALSVLKLDSLDISENPIGDTGAKYLIGKRIQNLSLEKTGVFNETLIDFYNKNSMDIQQNIQNDSNYIDDLIEQVNSTYDTVTAPPDYLNTKNNEFSFAKNNKFSMFAKENIFMDEKVRNLQKNLTELGLCFVMSTDVHDKKDLKEKLHQLVDQSIETIDFEALKKSAIQNNF